jgi:hypothetical protein
MYDLTIACIKAAIKNLNEGNHVNYFRHIDKASAEITRIWLALPSGSQTQTQMLNRVRQLLGEARKEQKQDKLNQVIEILMIERKTEAMENETKCCGNCADYIASTKNKGMMCRHRPDLDNVAPDMLCDIHRPKPAEREMLTIPVQSAQPIQLPTPAGIAEPIRVGNLNPQRAPEADGHYMAQLVCPICRNELCLIPFDVSLSRFTMVDCNACGKRIDPLWFASSYLVCKVPIDPHEILVQQATQGLISIETGPPINQSDINIAKPEPKNPHLETPGK